MRHQSARVVVVLTACLLLAVTACGEDDRPTVEEWRPVWDRAVAAIPSRQALGDDPSAPTCEAVLVVIREAAPDLLPSPDLAADGAVGDWVAVAEETFFECPPTGPTVTSFDEAYEELDRLRAEVELVIGQN